MKGRVSAEKKTEARRKKPVKFIAAKTATAKALQEAGRDINSAYAEMYLHEPREWATERGNGAEALTKSVTGHPLRAEYERRYRMIMERWGG